MNEETIYDFEWLTRLLEDNRRASHADYLGGEQGTSARNAFGYWNDRWSRVWETRTQKKFPISYTYYHTVKRSCLVPYHISHVCYDHWGIIQGFVSQLTENGDAVIVRAADPQWERLHEYFTHCHECLNTKRHYD